MKLAPTLVTRSLVLLMVVGTTLAAVASPDGQPSPGVDPNAAKQQAEKTMEGATKALEAALPKSIPVPEGPVVNKQELEGGLIVEDIVVGDGYEVKPGGAVVAHYHGTLKEGGKVFDSSFQRGEPIGFGLSGVIAGWQKGVPGMKVGGVRRLTIPAAMGYGAQGAGGDIPPNSDLVFVIQLVDALKVEDTQAGDGEAATQNCIAVTSHRILGADGKELDVASKDRPYVWLPGEFQPMQVGLDGMKVGGKRTVGVPAGLNRDEPQAAGMRRQLGLPERPTDVALTIEIELLSVRNLPMQRR